MQSDFTSNQQYTLHWNDYHKKIVNSFQSFHDADDFVDVTVACEGKTFLAHKVVLSACSPYFRSLLKANPCSHPIIMLQTISHKQFENIISFIYKGVVHVEPESLYEFLDAAKQLQIQGLTDVQYNQHFMREDSTERTSSPVSSNKNKNRRSRSSNKHSESTSEPGDDLLTTSQNNLSIINNKDKNLSTENSTEQEIIKIESADELMEEEEDTSQQQSLNLLPKPPDLNVPNNMAIGSMNFNQNPVASSTNLGINADTPNLAKQYRDPALPNGYRCIVCKRDYSSTSNLRAHVLNVHISSRMSKHLWYACNVCKKKCKTKHYLTNHQLQKHGIRQKDKLYNVRVPSVDISKDDSL